VYTALIQARTSSKRLPKKVIKKILNKEIFEIVYRRTLKSKFVKNAIILTSKLKSDDKIVKICKKKKIPFFRGSLKNVLKRYYDASIYFNLKTIIRITADCPLVDPKIIDQICKVYKSGNFDYVSNTIKPTFPDGLDVEIFSYDALKKTFFISKKKIEKEHVTLGMHSNNKIIKKNVRSIVNYSNYRFTLDTKDDLNKIEKIFKNYKSIYKPNFNILVKLIKKNLNKYKFIRKNILHDKV
jgi:spore coat polysaccharide biosynthesis protein SpsF (cytidylyltransferase family)